MASQPSSAENFIFRELKHEVQDKALLHEALDTTGLRIQQSNQRLALLGDAALKLVLLDAWYPTGAPKGTGFNITSAIGSNENLAKIGRELGLDAYIVAHPGQIGRISNKTMVTAMEALIGVVYLDSNKDLSVVKAPMSAIGLEARTG